jgi:4-oxalocrotonate tautomerase
MPHIIIKLQSGRTPAQKTEIADAVAKTIAATANCTPDAISVAIEDIAETDWFKTVYTPDILGKPTTIYKQPGYGPAPRVGGCGVHR